MCCVCVFFSVVVHIRFFSLPFLRNYFQFHHVATFIRVVISLLEWFFVCVHFVDGRSMWFIWFFVLCKKRKYRPKTRAIMNCSLAAFRSISLSFSVFFGSENECEIDFKRSPQLNNGWAIFNILPMCDVHICCNSQ